jgi:hypothetical protein
MSKPETNPLKLVPTDRDLPSRVEAILPVTRPHLAELLPREAKQKAPIAAVVDTGRRPRSEMLQWAKDRAHAYLKRGDPRNAVKSLMSDFTKFDAYPPDSIVPMMLIIAANNTATVTAKWIDDFN